MRGYIKFLLLLISVPLSLMVQANNPNNPPREGVTAEPVLQGSVIDASTKKPVQGVIVSVCTNKCQERKEVTTDATGNFKVPQMPFGEVTIVLEKKGYKTYRREGVLLKEGISIKLNMDIKSEEEEGDVFHPLMRMMDGE